MSKSLLFALFVGLSFSGYSIRKKKQLELLKSCTVVYEGQGILAGNSGNSYLKFLLEDGRTLYSNNRSKLGFRDFKIQIKGSGRSTWVSKRRLQLESSYDAYHDPYIHLYLEMIDMPEVKIDVSIPIHFNGHFKLNYSASPGRTGNKGIRGSSGNCGRNDYSHGNGENGEHGRCGTQGQNGSDGVNAKPLDVYVSLVDFHRDNTELVKIEGCYQGGKCWTRYVSKTGSMKIYNYGGNGGDGGRGGEGGNGGYGGGGAYKKPKTDTDRGCDREGWGGNGGNGGHGGRGGNGGNGGDGGDVYVYFKDDAKFFKSSIYIYTSGGNAGKGGKGGSGGYRGVGGSGGKGCGNNGARGACGSIGRNGYYGKSGQIFYRAW